MKARRGPGIVYTMVEHTADLGVEVSGESLSDLFAGAGAVLADLMFDPTLVAEVENQEVRLEAGTPDLLMVAWLNELLYRREVGGFLWRTVEAETPDGKILSALLRGEVFHPERHVVRSGIKAATYHQLRVAGSRDAWRARIIFDV